MSSEPVPSEKNKAIVQRLADEVVNQGCMQVADELFASSCDLHGRIIGPPRVGWGSGQVKKIVGTIRTAIPDVEVKILAQTAVGSDHVITEWTATGTHLGPLDQPPFKPTNERVEVVGMSITRLSDGHIEEVWLMQADAPEEPPPQALQTGSAGCSQDAAIRVNYFPMSDRRFTSRCSSPSNTPSFGSAGRSNRETSAYSALAKGGHYSHSSAVTGLRRKRDV